MPWWKQRSFFRSCWAPLSWRGRRSLPAPGDASASTISSFVSAERSWRESGSFLVGLLALVALGSIFAAASLKLILSAQRRVAIQARLDICAVELATSREKFLRDLVVSNQYVVTTVYAMYAARGLMVIPGIGQFAAASQGVILQANRWAAAWQEGQILLQQARELKSLKCASSPFSDHAIVCRSAPFGLRSALRREKAYFPDLRHRYGWTKPDLGSVTCFLATRPDFRTKLGLRGDPNLGASEFGDAYLH